MAKQLLRLFPHPSTVFDLENLYLYHHGWYQPGQTKPTVVANFVTSLDGRIAISKDATSDLHLPESLTSKEDFRLFLELYAQADCLITHGGYLRALEQEKLGNILQLPGDQDFEDLHVWRKQQGLSPHPDIVIASSTLDFPIHSSIKESGQKIYIATGQQADPSMIKKWKQQGHEVLITGKSKYVEGAPLVKALAERNYQHIYLIAGPKMLHTMVQGQQLNKLYLSSSHQFLGGEVFRTLLDGDVLTQCRLQLNSLFYDEASENKCGQFFSSYECIYIEQMIGNNNHD